MAANQGTVGASKGPVAANKGIIAARKGTVAASITPIAIVAQALKVELFRARRQATGHFLVNMPLQSEMVRKRGLSFANQRKVVILRDVKHMTWDDIASEVVNLEGTASTRDCVKRAYDRFNVKKGLSKYKFANCGRKRWKLTKDIQAYLVRRLLQLRRTEVCTSTTLQADLAKNKGVSVSAFSIRKLLFARGYRWRPRAQKRQYSHDDMKARLAWALRVKRMSMPDLRERFSLAMDGCVITVPPEDPTARFNFCAQGQTHMWRKYGEAAMPELAGGDPYVDQIPLSRAIPLWGGISEGGFAEVIVHKTKKMSVEEWVAAIRAGKLTNAIRKLKPVRKRGPWHVLCDNEKFLKSKESNKAYGAKSIKLWPIPPRSPDLNPIEKFWGWLRRALRRRDLADLRNKRPALSKPEYLRRVRSVLRTSKAQRVASNIARSLKKTCKEVCEKKGAASRG